MSKKQIHYNDAPIEQREVKAWFHGERFLGLDEHGARWAVCDVKDCETEGCHEAIAKRFDICANCEEDQKIEQYRHACIDHYCNYVDGDVLYSDYYYRLFHSREDLKSFLDSESLTVEDIPKLRLYLAIPKTLPPIDIEEQFGKLLSDHIHPRGYLGSECIDLIQKLNATLKTLPPYSYFTMGVVVKVDTIFKGETSCDK